jgi:hypothetical protein
MDQEMEVSDWVYEIEEESRGEEDSELSDLECEREEEKECERLEVAQKQDPDGLMLRDRWRKRRLRSLLRDFFCQESQRFAVILLLLRYHRRRLVTMELGDDELEVRQALVDAAEDCAPRAVGEASDLKLRVERGALRCLQGSMDLNENFFR